MKPELAERIERTVGCGVHEAESLSGGCIAEVWRVRLQDGREIVAKSAPQGGLASEAWMLAFLREHTRLPVPEVVADDDRLLLLSYIPNDGGALDAGVQAHAAELLADLHGIRGPSYGLERDTVIGGLAQPNEPSTSWLGFFRDRRLLYMGRLAVRQGSLEGRTFAALESLACDLGRWLEEPASPSLIHGDMWAGNILVRRGRIAGFVDPAVYYADAEIELAFSTLFSTFGEDFFARYREIRPIRPGFFEARREIYNLYPLLVHTVLFGGGYATSVASTLRRFVGL